MRVNHYHAEYVSDFRFAEVRWAQLLVRSIKPAELYSTNVPDDLAVAMAGIAI